MFSTKLLIAALAFVGTQAVSVQSLAEQTRGYQACLGDPEMSDKRCNYRRERKCDDADEGSVKWLNWECYGLGENGLAQVGNVSNSS